MSKNVMGMIIILAVIGATVFLALNKSEGAGNQSGEITVQALVGGEKSAFLKNPKVLKILANRYNITLKATKAGSIDMVSGAPTIGQDLLWPSNQVAVEIFRDRGGLILAEETIFNSPLVIYSWTDVAEKLTEKGQMERVGDTFYIKNFQELVEMVIAEKSWKEFGLEQLYGKVTIYSTDPTRSNSGNMFAGMLANMLNGGEVATLESLQNDLPRIKGYFQRLGHMEHSSGDLFENFLKTGMGAKPMIVGYENQLVGFALANESYRELLRSKVRPLYPRPTVWSSHPIIALTEKGKKFTTAMKDKDIQKIAWEEHGFRSGLIGIQNDPSVLNIVGIPESIESVMPLPDSAVMEAIIGGLQ